MDSELLTTKEVSTETRFKEATVRYWVAKRLLPHYRVGRQIRIKRSDLDHFLKANFVPDQVRQ